jgi:glycosyltransferase involved in cell wall biosynthesis
MVYFPSVSFAIPTYNSEGRLRRLLNSIRLQDYPSEKIEILIADGGSTDNTLQIANGYNCRIFSNPQKFAEPGKAVCIDNSTSELICFVDDDNVLPSKNWLTRMVEPFHESEIVAAEPICFEYSREMQSLDRYWALSGCNDPLFYYLGLYDKWNRVSGKWNGVGLVVEKREAYFRFKIHDTKHLPSIGANGFVVRKDVIRKVDYHNLLDVDKVVALIDNGDDVFAKVNVGIYHYFCSDLRNYVNKAKRKIGNMDQERRIAYPRSGIAKFVVYTSTFLPLILYSTRGYSKTKDIAWFLHIPLCWLTLIIYGSGRLNEIMHHKNGASTHSLTNTIS